MARTIEVEIDEAGTIHPLDRPWSFRRAGLSWLGPKAKITIRHSCQRRRLPIGFAPKRTRHGRICSRSS